jgi:hypothetical protein
VPCCSTRNQLNAAASANHRQKRQMRCVMRMNRPRSPPINSLTEALPCTGRLCMHAWVLQVARLLVCSLASLSVRLSIPTRYRRTHALRVVFSFHCLSQACILPGLLAPTISQPNSIFEFCMPLHPILAFPVCRMPLRPSNHASLLCTNVPVRACELERAATRCWRNSTQKRRRWP